jgi:predicted lipoprotein with Yx(FWY)xxD motif
MGLRALRVRVVAVAAVTAFAVAAALSAAALTTVNKAQNSALGGILETPTGWTLYAYSAENGGAVKCTGACATIWKPLLISATAKPAAGPGVSAKLLGTVKRPGSAKVQVTYKRHPLYTYSGDKKGQVNGQGIDGLWHALTPAGAVIMKSITSSGGSSSTGSSSSSSTSSNTGGSSTGGSNTGGSNTGGSNTGGSNTGGSGSTSTTPNDCSTNPGGYGCM